MANRVQASFEVPETAGTLRDARVHEDNRWTIDGNPKPGQN